MWFSGTFKCFERFILGSTAGSITQHRAQVLFVQVTYFVVIIFGSSNKKEINNHPISPLMFIAQISACLAYQSVS